MLKLKVKNLIFISLYCILLLSGCKKEVKVYENEPFMTELEYKASFLQEVNSQIASKRNIELPHIDFYRVSPKIKDKLIQKTTNILKDLNKNIGYSSPYYLHENFKYILDNLVQNGEMNIQVATNDGYYYATVTSSFVKNKDVDEFRKVADYLGIRGAIGYNLNGEENVDEDYLATLIYEVNKNRNIKGIDPVDTEIEQIDYLQDFDVSTIFTDVNLINKAELSTMSELILEDNSEEYDYLNSQKDIFNSLNSNINQEENQLSANRTVRRLNYDAEEFNNTLGSAKNVEYVIPNINALFKVKTYDRLAGYSLYNWGETFSQVMQNPTKQVELVFVFKYDVKNDDFILYTYYPKEIKSNIKVTKNKDLFISSFMEKELEIKIEQFHRAFCNKSLVSLTSGNLIYPQDLGIWLLKYRDSIDLINSDMMIDQVVNRDGNTYTVSAWQITDECIKNVSTNTGKFLREWLIKLKINGDELIITDMYITYIKCLRYPTLNMQKGSLLKVHDFEDVTSKISDELKASIKQELNKLEIALTHRTVNDDIIKNADNSITYKKNADGTDRYGFASRFNTDTSILSDKDRKEDLNILTSALIKYNTQQTQVYIRPETWLWSTDNQCALTICVLYNYGKRSDVINYKVVYSKLINRWVIDELTFDKMLYEDIETEKIIEQFLVKEQ